mmetsp:Transcript_9787/g.13464  ORF Transcript_9787/g.13464 Transcript_9787/m.13464 type:complete len:150 (+) Transcript_9787:56-505(+)
MASNMKCYALRLKPGEDLRDELLSFSKKHNLKAAFVLTCVGSLTRVTLRHANATCDLHQPNELKTYNFGECYEILSLVGTISPDGPHLHISLGDKHGNVIGGHLVGDAKIFTTAEIVLGELEDVTFSRPVDNQTGFDELVVSPKSNENL